jgi:hypothetical protein
MGVGGQRHAPAALPPGMTRYPLYRGLGGPQGQSGRLQKISIPPGFDPRTVQPVASRYTDYVIPAHKIAHEVVNIHLYHHIAQCFGCPQSSSGIVGLLLTQRNSFGWGRPHSRSGGFGEQNYLLSLSGIEILIVQPVA